jgi:hypothetical protein
MATDSVIEELDELHRASRDVRRRHEGSWYLNLAYLQGDQWTRFDGVRIFQEQVPGHLAKPVDNRIRPIVRKEIAKITKNRPTPVAEPATPNEKDVIVARYEERFVEHIWRELHLDQKRRAALLWSRVCGAGFWKITWDPEAGDSVEMLVYAMGHALEGQLVKDTYGKPIPASRRDTVAPENLEGVEPKRIHFGECRVDVRSPFEIFPDPLASDEGLSSAEWVGEEAVYSQEYVRSRFGVELEPDTQASAGIELSRFPGAGSMREIGKRGKGVKLREIWFPPSSKYANGKHCVWAPGSEKVLHEADNPYPWTPYAMFRGSPTPGSFWPDCTVDDLISQQTELNKREAQISDNADRIGNAPLLVSSANEDDFEWYNLPGQKLTFEDMGTPGSVPAFLQVPEVPGYIREDVGRIVDSMREISQQHEVSSGTVPPGVTAASAINLLQEGDDTVLGPDIEDMDLTLTEAARRLEHLAARGYRNERMLRVTGDEGAWRVFSFKGEMLKGRETVTMKSGGGRSQSNAAKQAALQEVLNMFAQSQVKISERDLRRVLKEYEIPGLEQFFATIGVTEQQINREHRRFLAGEAVAVNDYDKHDEHIDGHNEFRRSEVYEESPDDVKAKIATHVAEHVQRGTDAAVAQSGAGVPPGGGAPDAMAPPGDPSMPPGMEAAGVAGDNGGLPSDGGLPSALQQFPPMPPGGA